MDKNAFRALLESGTPTKRAPAGKANWEKILAALQKDGSILTTSTIWEKFVKKEVNRLRTKDWLHQKAEEGVCLRVYRMGQYYWTFNKELVEQYAKKTKQ